MLDLTIAIPTYNGEKRLPLVFEKLRSQTGTEEIAWEVLVVDNNSSDATAAIVEQFRQEWPGEIPLRYVFEKEQGLAFAREKAVTEANGEFVGFLDDDNLPTSNWVAAAYQFGKQNPQAGAYGGCILGDFEVAPPENFGRIASFLAIVDRGDRPLQYRVEKKILPPGAGLVVRTLAWREQVPKTLALVGRNTQKMFASEDIQVLRYIQQGGWEIWYNPAMVIYHRIPQHRLQKSYLMKLCFGVGASSYPIRMLKYPAWQRPFWVVLYGLNDTRKILWYLWKHKTSIQNQTVAAVELQFLLGRLVSPCYFLFKGFPIK